VAANQMLKKLCQKARAIIKLEAGSAGVV